MTASDRRVLVVTGDVLTAKMAGPAIRAWHIAHELATGHDVVLATTSGTCTRTSSSVRLEAPTREGFVELERWCDVLVVQGYVFEHVPELRSSEKLMVVDMYTPLHLETLALSEGAELGTRQAQTGFALAELNRQLVRGDYFICANERQRDLWIGQLSALGRINPLTWDRDPTLRNLIDIVPFGIDDRDPEHSRETLRGVHPHFAGDDEIVIWGGGVYNWLDPLTLIEAIDIVRRRRPKVRLYFMGLRHPNPDVPEMPIVAEVIKLATDLGLVDRHVFFNEGWVDYEDRQNVLLEADVAVSAHRMNAETRYAFRTRVLDYLWAGLPVVTTEGDELAALVEGEHLGLTVAPGDPRALAQALERLLGDDGLKSSCRANVRRVREGYRWSRVLTPLAEFCSTGVRAADRTGAGAPAAAVSQPARGGDELTELLRLARVAVMRRSEYARRILRQVRDRLTGREDAG